MTFSNLNILFCFNKSREIWCFSGYWLNLSHLPNDFWEISPSVLFTASPERSWESINILMKENVLWEEERWQADSPSHMNSDYLGRLEDVLSPKTFSHFSLSQSLYFFHLSWGEKRDALRSIRILSKFSSFGSNTLSPLALFLGTTCLLCASVILTKTFCGNLQQPLMGFAGSTCIVPSVVQ